jgi:hypothetical protein
MAQPCQEIQVAGVPGGGGRGMLAPLLVVLFALGLHAVITGRTLSPSLQARSAKATIRIIAHRGGPPRPRLSGDGRCWCPCAA